MNSDLLIIAARPADEARRLKALRSYEILDTPKEEVFDELVALAAQVCETPMAAISLIDERRLWFKAAVGFEASEAPRDESFSDVAMHRTGVFVVPDAQFDPAFARHPLVIGDSAVRFYAGAALHSPDGDALGSLSVLDRRPRRLTASQLQALSVLSRHVMAQFELRRQAGERNRVNRALLSLLEDERAAQAALRESGELNRGVLNSMLSHIAVVDRDGYIVAVNDAWRDFARENIGDDGALLARTDVGINYLEACRVREGPFVADAAAAIGGLTAVLRQERGSFSLEYPCHTRTKKRWFLMSATPLKSRGGGAAVSHLDITERKESETLLRLSNHRFELLARATNDAVRDWDLTTDTVWWNEGFETLFGFRRDGIESRIESWRGRIHPEDRARIEAGVREVIDSDEDNWAARYRFKRHDGSYAQVSDRGQLIRDEKGAAVRMLAGMTDVTERLALEDQLRQAHRLEAVGQLTGGVAHDFNNLLTVILGNAELLQEGLHRNIPLRELAEIIVLAANSASELTSRLLAFAGKQALSPIAVDSNRLLSQMIPMLKRTLGEDIEVSFTRGADLWRALVDPAQLENALLNLCINARDAMMTGGRLMIETRNIRLDEEYAARHANVTAGDYVSLSVTDTGCGIPPEIMGRIFEPFFTTKSKGKGTGLGLAMVYGFVKQSSGHISIYSEPRHGTAVKMYLPRAKADGVKEPAQSEAITDVLVIVHGDETILLVEDDEQVRRFAFGQLEALGYTVLLARNGAEALEIIEKADHIDLLFTDVVMPGGVSGRELADSACRSRPGLKVLFTSGYSADAIVHHGRLDPGVQLLAKPYRRAELAGRIRRVLNAPR